MGCGGEGGMSGLLFLYICILLLKPSFGIATSPAPVEGLVLYMIEIPAYVLRTKEMHAILYSIL